MFERIKTNKTFINFEATQQTQKNFTTQALGEEGGSSSIFDVKPKGELTTQALGEEGGDPTGKDNKITTMALGEEGSDAPKIPFEKKDDIMDKIKKDNKEANITTMATNEEGG